MPRWHLVESWWWNGSSWILEQSWIELSHPTVALRQWDLIGGPSAHPHRFNRCLYHDGREWQRCEWWFG